MRIIDADELMEDINESLSEMTSIGIAIDGDWLWAKLNDAIEHAPTIEERKKGKWIDYTDEGYVECPFCHSATNCEDNKDELHYCFSCGARLENE